MFRYKFDEHGKSIGLERHYVAGEVREKFGEAIPDYSLPCDGRAISRAEYAELFAVIGTTYGDGDGKDTFNVPDWQGLSQRRILPLGVIDPSPRYTSLTTSTQNKSEPLRRLFIFAMRSPSGLRCF